MSESMNEGPSAEIRRIVGLIKNRISEDVFGHESTADMLAGALLVGGHVLVEGPPGVAKTLLAKSFARATGLGFNRIQFTPDLMPSDITGVYIFDQSNSSFRLSSGPIFADIVLADEINRTPPKTQAALLEAMQEHFVTIDGKRHSLGDLFFVMATQNPVEHEGTYPLPEAQLDRFLFKLHVEYPGKEFEVAMINSLASLDPSLEEMRTSSPEATQARSGVVSIEELLNARSLLREIRLEASLGRYIHAIVDATRNHGDLLLGASPRAALSLALASKFAAAVDHRDYVIPDDIKQMSTHVLAHRLIFRPEVLESSDSAQKLIGEILEQIPVPDGMDEESE